MTDNIPMADDATFEAELKAAKEAAAIPEKKGSGLSSRLDALDSLTANEFAVEIEGEVATGIFRVSGLTTFKLEMKPGETKPTKAPIKIAKMVQRDAKLPFNQWLRETIEAGDDSVRPTRTLAVVAIDNGVETRRWTFEKAYISAIEYSDFDNGSGELVEETLTIHFDSLTETWTWSGAQ